MNDIGFGIIGCGVISTVHADAICSIEGANLVAVADIDRNKAQEKAKRYNTQWYTDHRKLLERENIQVVNIVTPSGLHADIGVEAAKSGKHLVVTKPIDINLEKIDSLIATCRREKVVLAALHQFRSYPSYRRIKRAVEENKLGNLVLGDAYVKWYRTQDYYDSAQWRGTQAFDGGCLMNQAIHYVDLLQWIMGEVESVFAYQGTYTHDIEVEDVAAATIKFKSGAIGVIEASTSTYPGFPARLEIHGGKGTVVTQGDRITRYEIQGEESKTFEEDEKATASSEPTAGFDEATKAHVIQLRKMIEAIKGKGKPEVTGEEARKPVELVLALYSSARKGSPVKLPLNP